MNDTCPECGTPFSDVPRAHRRRICVECLRVEIRVRKADHFGLFRRGERHQENEEIAKYYGRALLARRARMARYAEDVANKQPIRFDPRFRVR